MQETPSRQWERRAALRAAETTQSSSRTIASDIVRAAAELTEGADASELTVRQVAERAGVALQTFYRYFGTKDELLLALFEETIARGMAGFFGDTVAATPVERLRHLVVAPFLTPLDDATRRGMRWRARERERLREVFPEAVEAALEPYRAAVLDAIVAACSAGEATCDDPATVATILTNAVERVLLGFALDGGSPAAREAMGEAVWQLCWNGLAPRPSRGRRR